MEHRKIVAAAINLNGFIHTLPAPARHHDIIRYLAHDMKLPTPIMGDQGFMDEGGRFLMRKAAARIAIKNGQIAKLIAPPNLYSEDLW